MYAMHVCIDDDDDDDDVSSTRMHTNLYVRQGGYVSCLFLSITIISCGTNFDDFRRVGM